MKVDILTAMAAGITVLVVVGCQLLFFWTQDKRSNWLAWLIVPYALGATGIGLVVWRWAQADFLGFGIGYALILAAFGFLWQGIRIFDHRKPLLLPVLGSAVAWLALSLWSPFLEDMPLRIALLSIVIAAFCGLAARDLWRGRAEAIPSRIPTMIVAVSYACIMTLRIVLIGWAPYPIGSQPVQPTWVGVFNLIAFVHVAAIAVLMISMTKERRELEQRNDALTDPLTGLLNRRAFTAESRRIVYRPTFGGELTGLMVVDLDHFKRVNDRYGHDTGDRMLLRFAEIAGSKLRPTDALYRMGGEEFCFVLPDTTLADAIAAAERIRGAVEAASLMVDGEQVRITVSIGIATTDFAGFDLEVLLAAADAALYEAKARGRNRIVVAEPTSIPRPPDRPALRDLAS